MRPLALLLALLTVAGCDAAADLDPYDGIIEVALADGATTDDASLRLVAVDDASCADPLVVRYSREPASKRVTVEGIDRPQGGSCLAIIPPSAVVSLELGPDLIGGYTVEIVHAGAVDQYHLDLSEPSGPVLRAVRTSTTRLAE